MLLAVCEKVLLDVERKNISLISVVEQLTVPRAASAEAYLRVPLSIVSVLLFAEKDPLEIELRYVSSTVGADDLVSDIVNLNNHHHRRFTHHGTALHIHMKTCVMTVLVEWRARGEAAWHRLDSSFVIDVIIAG